MISVARAQVQALAPNAKLAYLDAFDCADTVFALTQVNRSALRIAHLMAQTLHETGGLTIFEENMNYRADRITQVWPSRFVTVASALPFERNPEKLANKVYAGRMGNTQPGDGYRFRGRGMIQVTGRESYAKFGRLLGIDLENDPELAVDPRYSLAIACAEYQSSGAIVHADRDDIVAVTKAINGGTVGLADRKAWLAKTKAVWS